jgi:hypothetical protein
MVLFFNILGITTADENIDFSFQIANYGYGLNFGLDKNNIELSLGLVNVFLDNPKTNIGLKISPFNLYVDYETVEGLETRSITYLNCINLTLYWNCLNEHETILGPFVSFEYITMRDWKHINFNDFTLNTDIKFMLKRNEVSFLTINFNNKSTYYIVEIDIGYRYNFYDSHKFYFSIKTDLILTLLGIVDIAEFFYKIKQNGSNPQRMIMQ